MWNYYAGGGFIEQFDTLKEIHDRSVQSLELSLSKGVVPIIMRQPYSNNEHLGNFTGGMFSQFNHISAIVFELPPEDTKIHIVALTHLTDIHGPKTEYAIRADVSGYYFGDLDWDDYKE